MNITARKYTLDSKGKRIYPKRSQREKWFGKLRQCKAANMFHGFKIQPGMWFGEDEDGFFATYGDKHGALFAAYRAFSENPKSDKDWEHVLEPRESVLTVRLEGLSENEKDFMLDLRESEHVRRMEIWKEEQRKKALPPTPEEIKARLQEVEAPKILQLRQSKPYERNVLGKPHQVRERNMLDVDPTQKPRLCVNYLPF